MGNKEYEQRCRLINLYLENKNFEDYSEEQAFSTKFSITENCENAEIEVLSTGDIKIHGEIDDLYDKLKELKDSIEDGTCFAYWFIACDDLLERFPCRAKNTVRFIKEAIACYLKGNNLAAFFMLGVAVRKVLDEYQKVDDTFNSRIADVFTLYPYEDEILYEQMSEDEGIALELRKYDEITVYDKSINYEIMDELNDKKITRFIENITKLFELMG